MESEIGKIAVIGMACRYPGANSVEEYWKNLIEGKETIKRFSDSDLRDFEINYEDLKKNPRYVPARGVLENIDQFDPLFFGYTPNEAIYTDPQHRVWLETVWEAFENAGCDPLTYTGAIGVYAGGYINTYMLNNLLRDPVKLENFIRLRNAESFQLMTGNDMAYLPTKTAYKFNLRGPAINVQTACSTSLVAIAQACQSLFSYDSDICIAGGVCIVTPQESGYLYQEGAIPSPDGHCRPFDANANGTVFSNGVGVVILKRVEDAIKDNDKIYAVINGWAINNDGNKKVSYTAPGIDGQTEVILMAQGFNNVNAGEIGYIEAHGTATNIGDPIEITALTKAFSQSTSKKQFCGIGSVKSNIGHTDAAAGVASFIKVCLSAYYRKIPATLHYQAPNAYIDFKNTPFYVVDKLTELESDKQFIAGVSSFGIGGTNAHIIVEEPPRINNYKTTSEKYIIPISAKSSKALENRKAQLIEFVKNNPDIDINDLAFTLWKGRNHMKYRASAVVQSTRELITDSLSFDNNIADEKVSSLAFMFPGQGAQYFRMGSDLYNTNEIFRLLVDEGFSILFSETGVNLKEILFDSTDQVASEKRLSETSITQPALFILEYSTAKILIENNIKPKYLIGHSIGEYVAACIAGVFDYPTALKIVIRRGQFMQSMKPGKMSAVLCNKSKLVEIGKSLFVIAAENAPDSCTISYETKDADEVEKLLESNEIKFIALNISHAFHSNAFEPILENFAEFINQFDIKPPSLPVISCLTGEFLTAEQAVSGEYWAEQLRNTVMFYSGITTILSNEQVLFIEVGPNAHLSSILRQIPEFENKKGVVLTLGRPESNLEKFIVEKVIGRIWTQLNFFMPYLSFIDSNAQKVKLPTYPFDRQRYWLEYKPEGIKQMKTSISEVNKEFVNSSIQDSIIGIWKEQIGIKEIIPSDNFFTIGGTSLLALSVIEKIEKKFKIKISLKMFLDSPRVRDIAEYIERGLPGKPNDQKWKEGSESRIISGEI
jgi:acyl transferase domain-containing protein